MSWESNDEKWEESDPRVRRRWLLIGLALLSLQLLHAGFALEEGRTQFGVIYSVCAAVGFAFFLWIGPYARRGD